MSIMGDSNTEQGITITEQDLRFLAETVMGWELRPDWFPDNSYWDPKATTRFSVTSSCVMRIDEWMPHKDDAQAAMLRKKWLQDYPQNRLDMIACTLTDSGLCYKVVVYTDVVGCAGKSELEPLHLAEATAETEAFASTLAILHAALTIYLGKCFAKTKERSDDDG